MVAICEKKDVKELTKILTNEGEKITKIGIVN